MEVHTSVIRCLVQFTVVQKLCARFRDWMPAELVVWLQPWSFQHPLPAILMLAQIAYVLPSTWERTPQLAALLVKGSIHTTPRFSSEYRALIQFVMLTSCCSSVSHRVLEKKATGNWVASVLPV